MDYADLSKQVAQRTDKMIIGRFWNHAEVCAEGQAQVFHRKQHGEWKPIQPDGTMEALDNALLDLFVQDDWEDRRKRQLAEAKKRRPTSPPLPLP